MDSQNPIAQMLAIVQKFNEAQEILGKLTGQENLDANMLMANFFAQMLADYKDNPQAQELPQETLQKLGNLQDEADKLTEFAKTAHNIPISKKPLDIAPPPEPPIPSTKEEFMQMVKEAIQREVKEIMADRVQKTQPKQQEPKEVLPPLTQTFPQEVAKEVTAQEPQTALVPITQEPQPTAQEEPPKAPVLYKDVEVHNPGQVAYHNDMYKVEIGNFGVWESNFLYAIFNIVKEQGDTIVHFNLEEIKALIGAPGIKNNEATKVVKKVWDKIKAANFWILLPYRDENHLLFRTFAINYHDKAKTQLKDIEVQVNHPHFTYLLNNLSSNFTAFQLQKFLSIKTKYAKNLFRLIERFKDQVVEGYIHINIYKNDFKGFCEFIGVATKYGVCYIDNKVLDPAIKELAYTEDEIKAHAEKNQLLDQRIYSAIHYTKIKAGRGGKVVGIVFEVALNPKTLAEQEARQKALKEKGTKSSILDTLVKDYKENQNRRLHFSTEDVKTLQGLIHSTGKLWVDTPEYLFKAVRLVDIYPAKTRKWIAGHFEVLGEDKEDLKASNHIALQGNDKWQYFKKPQDLTGRFVVIFEDIDKFLKDFKRGEANDTSLKLKALQAQQKDMQANQAPPPKPPQPQEQKPVPAPEILGFNATAPLSVQDENGAPYTFKQVQLRAYKLNKTHVGVLCLILTPTPRDLEVAKLYQDPIRIKYFKDGGCGNCDSPSYFVYVFKDPKSFATFFTAAVSNAKL